MTRRRCDEGDYIRFMPDDEVVSITIEYREAKADDGGEAETEAV